MPTQCTLDSLDFGRVEGRAVVADFSGGTMTSNAGALLLAQTDRAVEIIDSFAACFGDGRNPGLIEHTVRTLVGQRVIGIALGHEDLVDHDDLRHDPVLAAMLGKLTPRRKKCAPLAGKACPRGGGGRRCRGWSTRRRRGRCRRRCAITRSAMTGMRSSAPSSTLRSPRGPSRRR